METTLANVKLIAAEDTRKTTLLLTHLKIQKPLISLEKHNEATRFKTLYQTLQDGFDVAIVSDAGTPSISDPGSYTVSKLLEHKVNILAIPGPSAVTALVSVAGMGGDHYIFGGFFPKKPGQALTMLKQITSLSMPILFFESPKRIKQSIRLIEQHYPTADCVLGKELTKIYETLIYGKPSEILPQLSDDILKGEWCFILSLPKETKEYNPDFIKTACDLGLTQSQIGALVKTLGWNKKDVYNYVLTYKD